MRRVHGAFLRRVSRISLCFDLFDEASECLRIILGECREGFTVEIDIRFFEGADEFGIRDTRFTCSRVDAEREELAIIALLRSAVGECVDSGVSDCFFCDALFRLAVEAVALGLREEILPPLVLHCSSFYSCHIDFLCEVAAAVLLCHLHGSRAALALTAGTGVLGIEMVLADRACDDFAALGDAEALCE